MRQEQADRCQKKTHSRQCQRLGRVFKPSLNLAVIGSRDWRQQLEWAWLERRRYGRQTTGASGKARLKQREKDYNLKAKKTTSDALQQTLRRPLMIHHELSPFLPVSITFSLPRVDIRGGLQCKCCGFANGIIMFTQCVCACLFLLCAPSVHVSFIWKIKNLETTLNTSPPRLPNWIYRKNSVPPPPLLLLPPPKPASILFFFFIH